MSGEPAPKKKGFDPGAFLGISGKHCDPKKSRFVVIPVPYEKTTTYKKGTAKGPEAIIDASRQVELYDETLGGEYYKVGVTTMAPVVCKEGPEKLADQLETIIEGILDREQIPVVLGGEHSISLGTLRAAQKKYPNVCVLHFDAHGDLRDEYEGTRYGHGCVMGRVHDLGIPLVQVGIRSLCLQEHETIKKSKGKIKTFFASETHALGNRLPAEVLKHLGDPVFISIDVDGFDSSVIAATGTPEPGGLNWWDVMDTISMTIANRKVVGFDVMELLPTPGLHASDFATARLTYKIMGHIAKARDFSEIE